MKRAVGFVLLAVGMVLLIVGCEEQPAYYRPYDDVSSDTTTVQNSTQPSMTAMSLAVATTTEWTLPTTTALIVPEGYEPCPTCGGVKTLCPYCGGTGRRKGEKLDANTGIYKSYYSTCGECTQDKGYAFCETCQNELVVPLTGGTQLSTDD